MLLLPTLLGLACTGTAATDSGGTATEVTPAWTQSFLSCTQAAHAWSAYANGLFGHAQLRFVPGTADGVVETHPLVVEEADPSGSWTLFAVALAVDGSDPLTVPGSASVHDCRQEGFQWTWALDLLDDGRVVACTAWEGRDTAAGPEEVATCDVTK